MQTQELSAERRDKMGSAESRRLRRHGRLPVNLYGHGEAPEALHVDAHGFANLVRHHARMLSIRVGDRTETAVIHQVQHDPISEDLIHVDFLRVSLTEKVVVPVPLRLHGPAEGQKDGGILQEHHAEVAVRCLPTDIPEEIVVDIRPLKVHESIHVSDLVLPANVEAADEPGRVLITLSEPRYGIAEAEAAEGEAVEGEGGEPEVIGKEGGDGDAS